MQINSSKILVLPKFLMTGLLSGGFSSALFSLTSNAKTRSKHIRKRVDRSSGLNSGGSLLKSLGKIFPTIGRPT